MKASHEGNRTAALVVAFVDELMTDGEGKLKRFQLRAHNLTFVIHFQVDNRFK